MNNGRISSSIREQSAGISAVESRIFATASWISGLLAGRNGSSNRCTCSIQANWNATATFSQRGSALGYVLSLGFQVYRSRFARSNVERKSSSVVQPFLYSFALSITRPMTRKISRGQPLTSSNLSPLALATISRISWVKQSRLVPEKARIISSLLLSAREYSAFKGTYQARLPMKKTALCRRPLNPSAARMLLHTDIAPVM